MSDRWLTMTAEQWALAVPARSYWEAQSESDRIEQLRAEVLAQAARVQALEQERERIRQALQEALDDSFTAEIDGAERVLRSGIETILASLPPAGEREET